MATIPLGPGRRVLPQRAPSVQIADLTAPARALEAAGATGVQMGLRAQARMDAEAAAESRRQEATREAAERARDAVQLQRVEDQLADLHDELGGQVLRGEVQKADAERVWTERSRKVIDDGNAGFSDFGKQTVAGRLDGAALRLGNSVRRTVEKKDREDVTADMGERLERLQRDYGADPAKAEKEASVVFDTLGPFSTLGTAGVAAARQKWLEGAQFTAGYEAVSRGRNDPKALADAEKLIGGMQHIDPQKRAVLMDRAAGYRLAQEQRREIAAQRAAREAERLMTRARAEFESFQALADKGGALDPAYIDRVSAATAGTPYQAGVQALAKLAQENGGLAAQPIAAQQQALDAIDARIAQSGRTPELDKRRGQVAKVLEAARADLQRDGMRAALERGIITELQPLTLAGGIPGVAQQLQQRVVDAQRVSQWAGGPVSPLTGDEAQQLGRVLTNLPADQFGDSVAVLAQALPTAQMQAVAKQIDKGDRAMALAFSAGADRSTLGRTTAELIRRGAQAMAEQHVKLDNKGNAEVQRMRQEIYASIGNALSGEAREQVADAAMLIQYGWKTERGIESGVGRAVKMALGGDILRVNGQDVPVVAGVTMDRMKERLAAYPADEISKQAGDEVFSSDGTLSMSVKQFVASLPRATLRAAGQGRYYVGVGTGVALNAKGEPIVIEVR